MASNQPTKTTSQAFAEFDDFLKLDPDERAAAEDLHGEVTDLLEDRGLIVDAFLQGSFRRKTMIAPLRDVDKVVILDPSLRGIHPDTVMDRLQGAIGSAYNWVTFERSRHALQADFGSETFYFDIVPAWETDTDDDDVCIGNRESGGWERSNTRELIRAVSKRNIATGGQFIHQVRMVKQAIKHLLDGSIPGLHIESWAFMVITSPMANDEAVARILENGARLLGHPYHEPTGVDLISSRLQPDVVAQAKPVVEDAAGRARQARLLADAGDDNESVRIWLSILGDGFPQPKAQTDGDALRRSFLGGSVTAAGTVSRSNAAPQRTQPVRPWRTA